MPDNEPAIKDFSNTIKKIFEDTKNYFESKTKESIVPASEDTWSFAEELTELEQTLQSKIAKLKEQQMEKLMKELKVKNLFLFAPFC